MDDLDLINLLEQQIVSHPMLKDPDSAVVRKICAGIRVVSNGNVDRHLREQVSIEAGCVYLVGRYQELFDKLDTLSEDRKAARSLELEDDETLSKTKTSRDYYVRTFDHDYRRSRANAATAGVLIRQLNGLSKIVFERIKKLEQLSINVRREMQADSNS